MGNILFFFFLLIWSCFTPHLHSTCYARGNARAVVSGPFEPQLPVGAPSPTPIPIGSDVHLVRDSKEPMINYATISKPDALNACPLETLPADLGLAISQLVKKVSDSVSKIKATRSEACDKLQQTLNNTQSAMAVALQNQFIAGQIAISSTNQAQINLQTQQATAVNLMILTTAHLIQRKCIEALDDRIVIQRLVGQLITLGGLFMGGWQGVAVAAGGQLFSNAPIFKNDVDTAVALFQKYDEINERGSFLCLYRQILKTSCLLFSEPEDDIVYGLDLRFRSGPTKITQESIREIEKKFPKSLEDAKQLSAIIEDSPTFLAAMEKADVLQKGSVEGFQELKNFCSRTEIKVFQEIKIHPIKLHQSLMQIQSTCDYLKNFKMPFLTPTETAQLLAESYWSLMNMKGYYTFLRTQAKTPFSEILNTWESKRYFDGFKKSMDEYRDHLSGNQARMNYLAFSERLGSDFATTSFKALMKQNYRKLIESKNHPILRHLYNPLFKPSASPKVRQRAAYAMMDLCQTLDPTLACLTPEIPARTNALHKLWKESCVGPKSRLCHSVMRRGDHYRLIDEPKYKIYFDSLCGTNTSTVGHIGDAEGVLGETSLRNSEGNSGKVRFSAP